MTYLTGDIPAGAYDSQWLANIGSGHGAIDAGGGWAYLNQQNAQLPRASARRTKNAG